METALERSGGIVRGFDMQRREGRRKPDFH
jgi:hypothetical protein